MSVKGYELRIARLEASLNATDNSGLIEQAERIRRALRTGSRIELGKPGAVAYVVDAEKLQEYMNSR
jgi:hypothetical protein